MSSDLGSVDLRSVDPPKAAMQLLYLFNKLTVPHDDPGFIAQHVRTLRLTMDRNKVFITENPGAFVPVIEVLQMHFGADSAVNFAGNSHIFNIDFPAVDWFSLGSGPVKRAMRLLKPGCPSWAAVSSASKRLGIDVPSSSVNVETSGSTYGALTSTKAPPVASASPSSPARPTPTKSTAVSGNDRTITPTSSSSHVTRASSAASVQKEVDSRRSPTTTPTESISVFPPDFSSETPADRITLITGWCESGNDGASFYRSKAADPKHGETKGNSQVKMKGLCRGEAARGGGNSILTENLAAKEIQTYVYRSLALVCDCCFSNSAAKVCLFIEGDARCKRCLISHKTCSGALHMRQNLVTGDHTDTTPSPPAGATLVHEDRPSASPPLASPARRKSIPARRKSIPARHKSIPARRKHSDDPTTIATAPSANSDGSQSPSKKRRCHETDDHTSIMVDQPSVTVASHASPSTSPPGTPELRPTADYLDRMQDLFTQSLLEHPPNEPMIPPVLLAPSPDAIKKWRFPTSKIQPALDAIHTAQRERVKAIAAVRIAETSYNNMVAIMKSSDLSRYFLNMSYSDFVSYPPSDP